MLLLALVGMGCGDEVDDGVVEIDFWAMGSEGEVVERLLPEFERRHPDVRVRVQVIPWASAHEKLLTAFAGDATPDLCQLGNTWIPEFVLLDALENLEPWLAESEATHPADFFPGIWATNVIDGAAYGVPWYVDTRLLFYRTDLLERAGYDAPPRTWAEWTEALRALESVMEEGSFPALMPVNEFEPPIILALQQDGDMLREGGRYGNFRGEDFRRAFTFYVDLFRQGLAPKLSNTQVPNVAQEFARGHIGFYITGPWNIGQFRERLPDDVMDDWSTAPMPGPKGSPGTSVAGGSSLVIFEASAHKEAAWQLVEYLTEPETQVRFHELSGNLPSREAAWEDTLLTGNPYADAFRRQLGAVRPTPQVPEWERIATLIRLYAEEVVYGRLDVDAALERLDADVDRLLEKRRWMLDHRG